MDKLFRYSRILSLAFVIIFTFFVAAKGSAAVKTIAVERTGVYFLPDSSIKAMGFKNPRKLRVKGLPAGTLSNQSSAGSPAFQFMPSAYVEGRGLQFYAEGPVSVRLKSATSAELNRNYYSNQNFYLLSEEDASPDIIKSVATTTVADTHFAVSLHELDIESPAKSSVFYFGERLRPQNSLDVSLDIRDAVRGKDMNLRCDFAAKSPLGLKLDVSAPFNFLVMHNNAFPAPALSGPNALYSIGYTSVRLRPFTSLGDSLNLNLKVPDLSASAYCALDKIVLVYQRNCILDRSNPFREMFFQPEEEAFELTFPEGEKAHVWSMDSKGKSVLIEPSSENIYSLPHSDGSFFRTVEWLESAEYPYPLIVDENIPSVALEACDGLIVAAPHLRDEAQELAAIHRDLSGINLKVVTDKEIYVRYSLGTPDAAAIRLFAAETARLSPSFLGLLLYGGGTWDNRHIEVKCSDAVSLVTYHNEDESLNRYNYSNYCTDQYYGLEKGFGDILKAKMIFPVGRVPARDAGQARAFNRKIRRILNTPIRQDVSTTLLVLCDDKDGLSHFNNSEDIASIFRLSHVGGMVYRGYNDLYPLHKGDAAVLRKYVGDCFRKGVGWWYVDSHCDGCVLAAERIWSDADVASTVSSAMPISFLAACSAGDFDRRQNSLAESMLFVENGGAPVVLAPSRSILLEYTHSLSKAFFNEAPEFDGSAGQLFMEAKNKLIEIDAPSEYLVNALCFNFLGDIFLKVPPKSCPFDSIVLEIPADKRNMVLDKSSGNIDSLPVLTPIKLSGCLKPGVEGLMTIRINDPKRKLSLASSPSDSVVLDESVLLQTSIKVDSAVFSLPFVIPDSYADMDAARNLSVHFSSSDGNCRFASEWVVSRLVRKDNVPPGALEPPEIMRFDVVSAAGDENIYVGDSLKLSIAVSPGTEGLKTGNATYGSGLRLSVDGNKYQNLTSGNLVADKSGTLLADLYLSPVDEGLHRFDVRILGNAGSERTMHKDIFCSSPLPEASVHLEEEVVVDTLRADISDAEKIAAAGWRVDICDARGLPVWTRSSDVCPFPLKLDIRKTDIPSGPYTLRTRFVIHGTSDKKLSFLKPVPFVFLRKP